MGSSHSHEQSRKELYLLILVVVPFVGRFVIDFLLQLCKEKINQLFGDRNPLREAILPQSKPNDVEISDEHRCAKFVLNDSDSKEMKDSKAKVNEMLRKKELQDPRDLICLAQDLSQLSIAEACICMGWTNFTGYAVLLLRVVFWHWMQPIMYWWALYSFSDQISAVQLGLGCVVAGREAFYLLFTLIGLATCPQMFLINLTRMELLEEGEGNKKFLLFMYIAMPEKFLYRFLIDSDKWPISGDCLPLPLPVGLILCCDAVAAAALVHGLATHDLPYPLAVGYGVAALSGVWVLVWITNALLQTVILVTYEDSRKQ